MLKIFGALRILDEWIEKISLHLLVISIFSILFLGLTTVVLRWMEAACLWIDPLVRHLVFLAAFLGGVLATGSKQHIRIDILSKYFEHKHNEKMASFIEPILSLTCLLTIIWLIAASFGFVKLAFDFEGIVFLGIHRGVLVSIIPFGFSLIGYRFFYQFLSNVKKLV